jgi:hypothetical protein
MLHLHWTLLFWGPSNSYVDNAGLEWCYSSPAKFFRVAFQRILLIWAMLFSCKRNQPFLPWRMFCRKVQHKFRLCGMFLCSLQLVFFHLTVAKFATFFWLPIWLFSRNQGWLGYEHIFLVKNGNFLAHKEALQRVDSFHIFSIVLLREGASCSSLTKPMLT